MSEAMNYGLCLDSGEFISADELNSQAEQANRPLDERDARIAELEQRNTDLYEDVQRFKEHALSEKDARMALERELAEVRKQMDAQKDEWLSWDAKRRALEKDAGRLDWLAVNPVDTLELFGRVTGDFTHWPKWIRGDIDAAMKGQ